MGASSSKATSQAAALGSAARKYPSKANLPSLAQQATSPRSAPRPDSGTVTPSGAAPPPTSAPASVHPPPQASGTRDAAINTDASDPDFARSLRSLGPVQPNPTQSNSSSAYAADRGAMPQGIFPPAAGARTNPVLMVLEARERLAREAEREQQESAPRRFADVYTIRQILNQRSLQGADEGRIEKNLNLSEGVVRRLGKRGVVELAGQ